jgi:hypothetical protein
MLSIAVQILRTLNPTLSSRMQEILGCSLRLPNRLQDVDSTLLVESSRQIVQNILDARRKSKTLNEYPACE